MLEVTRTTNNEVERSKSFFITSLDEDIDGFMRAARKHWSIETNLHWSLDLSFREDLNRARAGHSAQNLATVRRIALNLLTQENTHKRGISCKRKTAGWNNKYLMKVLKMVRSVNTFKCVRHEAYAIFTSARNLDPIAEEDQIRVYDFHGANYLTLGSVANRRTSAKFLR